MIRVISVFLVCALTLVGCGGADESQTPAKGTSPNESKPAIKPLDTNPRKAITKGGHFSYQYSVNDERIVRIVEPAKLGIVKLDNGMLQYQAGPEYEGVDTFRLELVEPDSVTMINWMVRVTGEKPRFVLLEDKAMAKEHEWQCIDDNQTHLGVRWVMPKEPTSDTFSWQDWQATLPNLEASCFLGHEACTTDALIEYANQHQWCGRSDWRLPFEYEMKSIKSERDYALDRNQPAIDPYYFATVGFEEYWLATDASSQMADNLAHRYSFGTKRYGAVNANKRKPTSVMLVSGEFRDPSLPVEAVTPEAESNSFIRLDARGMPLNKISQQDSYDTSPWRCLDDVRPLVRDNLFLRDKHFSYVYWLTPNQSDITTTANLYSLSNSGAACQQANCSLKGYVDQVNLASQCGKSSWRVPTVDELAMLMHQQVNGGGYELLYKSSLNNPEAGEYWVKTEYGYGTVTLPFSSSLSVQAPVTDQQARALLIVTEAEPRMEEDPRSIGNHTKPDMRRLRQDYATTPDRWPQPFVDDMSDYQEIGLMTAVAYPSQNPYSAEKAQLGKALFFDPLLSKNQDVACASCHDPKKGWTDQQEVSIGHAQQRGKRNAPTIVNSGFLPALFWDGRAATLEQQALMPIQDPLEMAETLPNVVEKLQNHPKYPNQFKRAFGKNIITKDELAMALATFQRTITSNESKLDRFIKQASTGQTDELSDQELWGLDIYRRNGRCVNCHMGPELTNHKFENVGLTYYKAFYEDLGQFNVSGQSDDVGRFKTPSLRDVMNTGPWFHNGLVHTMDGVISMYSEGMASNAPFGWDKYDPNYPKLSDKIRPLNLTYQEAQALKAFMHVITAPSPNP
ncbi:cytochrome c peroxidase [Vibrio sp. NTOU-M3]|uniref:cytochrome c peroxidase n=1 Tax=Vibrio sp. NTOU-M3 TaxID=3234954 RepID=UPI00349F118F